MSRRRRFARDVPTSAAVINFDDFAKPNGTATLSGDANVLTVTESAQDQAGSAFTRERLSVTSFFIEFTYQATAFGGVSTRATGADGIAFVFQNDIRGTTALGGAGGDLGAGQGGPVTLNAIHPAVLLAINVFDNPDSDPQKPGESLKILTTGADIIQRSYRSTGDVDLRSGDPIQVRLSYDGARLNVSLTDLVAETSYSHGYNINIPDIVGDDLAYFGFTGGTGLAWSKQTVTGLKILPEPVSTAAMIFGSTLMLRRQRKSRNDHHGAEMITTEARRSRRRESLIVEI